MSTRRARVTVAYATVKLLDSVTGKWTVAGFYQGAVLPIEADPENVASLVRREYAEWLDSDEAKTVEKQETEAEEAQEDAAKQRMEAEAAAVEADKAVAETTEVEEDVTAAPAQSASKADWVAYAVSRRDEGVSEEDARATAEATSKADLIAEYGG